MICLEDCIAMCGLSEEEVLAIAEHEHLPEIAATALAQYLLNQQHGAEKIRYMITDDVRQAQARGDRKRVHAAVLAKRNPCIARLRGAKRRRRPRAPACSTAPWPAGSASAG